MEEISTDSVSYNKLIETNTQNEETACTVSDKEPCQPFYTFSAAGTAADFPGLYTINYDPNLHSGQQISVFDEPLSYVYR